MIFIILIITIILTYISFKRYKVIFNPFILSIQVPLFFLLIPQSILIIGFEGEDNTLSDIVILVYTFSIFIGSYIKPPKLLIPNLKNTETTIQIIFVLCMILIIPLLPLIIKYGLSFRGLREFYEYVVFSSYSSIYSILKVLLSCIIVIWFIKRKRLNLKIIVLAIILIFSGSKMAILSTFILFGTLWEQYRRINPRKLIICSVIVACGMVSYHSVQNTNDKIDAINGALSYFDVYKQQSMALEMLTNNELDFFNGEIYFSSFYSIIPRLIWPEKPKDFGFALLNYKIYPQYSADGYMPSFGLAYVFADFGFISLILSGIMVGFFKNMWYRELFYNNKNIPSFIIYAFGLDIIISFLIFICYSISTLKSNKFSINRDSQDNSSLLA